MRYVGTNNGVTIFTLEIKGEKITKVYDGRTTTCTAAFAEKWLQTAREIGLTIREENLV